MRRVSCITCSAWTAMRFAENGSRERVRSTRCKLLHPSRWLVLFRARHPCSRHPHSQPTSLFRAPRIVGRYEWATMSMPNQSLEATAGSLVVQESFRCSYFLVFFAVPQLVVRATPSQPCFHQAFIEMRHDCLSQFGGHEFGDYFSRQHRVATTASHLVERAGGAWRMFSLVAFRVCHAIASAYH